MKCIYEACVIGSPPGSSHLTFNPSMSADLKESGKR